ncbi:MAG: hypothetical protein V9F82_05915 [Dermatophilaceae bacterium]
MAELTQEDRNIVRGATFGAMSLVSRADPGFFDMFKESLAGSQALAAAPEELRRVLAHGAFVVSPSGSADDLEKAVVEQISQATRILAEASHTLLEGFRAVVLTACDAVAAASGGVVDPESAAIARIRGALGGHRDDPSEPAAQ